MNTLEDDMDEEEMEEDEEDTIKKVDNNCVVCPRIPANSHVCSTQWTNLHLSVVLNEARQIVTLVAFCIVQEDVKMSPEQRGGYRDWDRPRRSPSPRYKRSRSKSPHRRRFVHCFFSCGLDLDFMLHQRVVLWLWENERT